MKIKVLSWNIWCGTHLKEVIDFLREADADIIALQEIAEDERGNISEKIAKELGYNFAHAIEMNLPLRFLPGYDKNSMEFVKFGNAILSKHKIISSKKYELTEGGKRFIVGTDIEVGDKILHVFSVHLKHTHQKPSELQERQAENLINFAPKKNTLIMGDFNALPETSVIQKMNKSLQNTEVGKNTPTWSVYKECCSVCVIESIKYKLDYIFTSKDIKTNSFNVHKSKASDHLPISAEIEI